MNKKMSKALLFCCIAGLLGSGSALACDIVNKQEISVGVSTGVAGECPNNGGSIQCISDEQGSEGLTCNGPEGSYSGSDLPDLIATACGCGANADDTSNDQIEQELE
jgi:putative hemolysin